MINRVPLEKIPPRQRISFGKALPSVTHLLDYVLGNIVGAFEVACSSYDGCVITVSCCEFEVRLHLPKLGKGVGDDNIFPSFHGVFGLILAPLMSFWKQGWVKVVMPVTICEEEVGFKVYVPLPEGTLPGKSGLAGARKSPDQKKFRPHQTLSYKVGGA